MFPFPYSNKTDYLRFMENFRIDGILIKPIICVLSKNRSPRSDMKLKEMQYQFSGFTQRG